MGSCLTKKEFVEDFELEFDEYGSVTIRNRYSNEVILKDKCENVVSILKDIIFTTENFKEI